jgi:hypothetical protein
VDVLERPAPRLGGPALVKKQLGAAAGSGWHRIQLARTADGQPPLTRLPALVAALDYTMLDAAQALLARRSRMELARQAERLRGLPAPPYFSDRPADATRARQEVRGA